MNLIDLLSEYNVSYREHGSHHHTSQGRLQVDCPQCSKDSGRFRLGLNVRGLFATCWTCGYLQFIPTLSEILGISPDALRYVLKTLDYDRKPEDTLPVRGTLKLPKGTGPLLKPHKEYLKRRGFNPDKLEQFWGLKGIGVAPHNSWRILIPIHYKGEVVSWTTRSISDNGTRYIKAQPHEERIAATSLLFGEDHVRHSIIVTEGSFDVMKIGPGAVALMGLLTSASQIQRIAKYPRRMVCLDNEPAAQKRAVKLCNTLSAFPGNTWNIALDSKDAAESSKKEIKELRKFLE